MSGTVSSPSRLLVVDDIAPNRAILTRYFSRRGFEVIEAEDGVRALALIDQNQFDAVLLDVVMPGMNGFEVLKRIRAIHPASVLPVIMITAKIESEDIALALELGANDYVTKPIDFKVASARLQSQLARVKAEQALFQHLEKLEVINRRLEHEIAEREQSEAVMRHMAQHDSLTGLTNRREFRDQLDSALAEIDPRGASIALLFLDLDQFKLINDTLGHRFGDLLLIAAAERIKQATKDCATVARLGGDEFAIIQYIAGADRHAGHLADRIIKVMAQPFEIEGHALRVSSSIGISCAPADGRDSDSLLANADLALYQAKEEARGSYRFFEHEMNVQAQGRRQLEADLRDAIQKEQFELFYQPLLNMSTGVISGFEALLRWHHPSRGMVSPLEFIPVAEKTGLIVPISQWVLREACREAARWPGSTKVAVNLSPMHFRVETLLDDVKNALALTSLDPTRLELEITESILIDDEKQTMKCLHTLRGMGIRISMDDFGTGYSSLSYLRMFPFDKIKIDRSFVRHLPEDPGSLVIVSAIIGLATKFGMVTTAEGVETEEQKSFLRTEGCTEVQGYLVSRPVPADRARAIAQIKPLECAVA